MKHVDMRQLPAAAQEERRRQVIGLRQAGMTYDAIAAQVGLSPTGVFAICKRYAERGAAGLKTGPRGPEPGYGRFLDADQEAEALGWSSATRLTNWTCPLRSGAGQRCGS